MAKRSWLLIPALTLLCCSRQGSGATVQAQCPAPKPCECPAAPPQAVSIEQWGFSVKASSQYGSGSWSAAKAAGAPDTSGCGDSGKAWAAASLGGVEWLEITYPTPVLPMQINIYENNHPGTIVKVEVGNPGDAFKPVWSSVVSPASDCPRILPVPVLDVHDPVTAVRVTLDLTNATDWGEIDAVQLVGMPVSGSGAPDPRRERAGAGNP